jgi:hypothetical protein
MGLISLHREIVKGGIFIGKPKEKINLVSD